MRTCIIALALVLVPSGIPAPAEPPEEPARERPDVAKRDRLLSQIERQMPAARVRQFLGPPNRIARQVLFRRHLEQWIYDAPLAVRVEFFCVPGEEARVLNVLPDPLPQEP